MSIQFSEHKYKFNNKNKGIRTLTVKVRQSFIVTLQNIVTDEIISFEL